MGGAVSSGNNNDDLINNLLEADYIKTPIIERVFRAVDRGEYFLPQFRMNAYKDLAWKNGHLHMSAPCIYSEVMEGLCLQPGLSFLNLGSGTGYLSTMVGLILGSKGTNHGIELFEDAVTYARKKLYDFKLHSGAMDEWDFCEPVFVQGNGLCLSSNCPLYDRVYCGAACPAEFDNYMKRLIKVGGILVMPLNDQLQQIKRTAENTWVIKVLLPVTFASLIPPSSSDKLVDEIGDFSIPSLQSLCRTVVRNILRKNIEAELPAGKRSMPSGNTKAPRKKRALKRFVVPLFDSDSDSDDEYHQLVHLGNAGRNRNAGRAMFRTERSAESMEVVNENQEVGEVGEASNVISDQNDMEMNDNDIESSKRNKNDLVNRECGNASAGNAGASESSGRGDNGCDNMDCDQVKPENSNKKSNPLRNRVVKNRNISLNPPESSCSSSNRFDNSRNSINHEDLARRKARLKMRRIFASVLDEFTGLTGQAQTDSNHSGGDEMNLQESSSSDNSSEPVEQSRNQLQQDDIRTAEEVGNRIKFDSGLGEDIVQPSTFSLSSLYSTSSSLSSSDEDDNHQVMQIPSKSSSSNSVGHNHNVQCSQCHNERNSNASCPRDSEGRLMYNSPFTPLMRCHIQQLPLPMLLKQFINYDRNF